MFFVRIWNETERILTVNNVFCESCFIHDYFVCKTYMIVMEYALKYYYSRYIMKYETIYILTLNIELCKKFL